MRADIKERIAMIERGEVPEGYKKTRFGIIPHNWGICSTQHIGLWFGGYAFKSEEFLDEAKPNTVQVIKMGNVKMCRLELSTNPAYLEFGKINNGLTKYMLKTGDVLITLTGTVNKTDYGNVAYISEDGKYVLNQRVGCLRIENVQEKSYYYYYFQSRFFRRNFFILGVGGTGNQANVSITDLSMLQVIKPTSIEQKKIAGIISVWDRAIELKERLLEQRKLQKKGLMERLLTGKVRLSGYNKEWKTYTIGELVQKVNRPIVWDEEFQYKLISVRRRSEGIFFREALYGNQILTKTLQPVKTGDFLISKMQILHGALSYVERQFDGMYVSDSYYILKSIDELKLTMQYFDYLSRLPMMYYKAFVSCYGVHIEKMTFNLDLYLEEKITIPPNKEEQEGIINVLKCIENEISLVGTQITQLKTQKKGLMQLLLTGKVRVPC